MPLQHFRNSKKGVDTKLLKKGESSLPNGDSCSKVSFCVEIFPSWNSALVISYPAGLVISLCY